MAEYYEKLIDLQNKLRWSEEERLKLEIKFNEIIQVTREEEQLHYRKLRHQYKIFLEEDRKRQERNEKILRTLEKIDTRISRLASKSQVYQRPRRLCRYCRSCETPKYPSCTDDILKPEGTARNLPKYEQKYPKEATSELGIIDEYLNSMKKTHKSFATPKQFEPASTTELDNLKKGLNKKFDSNQANSIAAEIMNSIYSRRYEKVCPGITQPQFKEDNINLSSSVSSKQITETVLPKDLSDLPEKSAKYGLNSSLSVPDNRKEEIRGRVEKSDESNHDKEDESKIAQELNCLAKENYSEIIENTPDLIVQPVEERPPEKLTEHKKITEAQQNLLDNKNTESTRTNDNNQSERPGDQQIQEDEVPVPPSTSMGDDQRDHQYDEHGKVIDYGPDNNQLMNQCGQNYENGLIIAHQQHEKSGENNIDQYEPHHQDKQVREQHMNGQRIDQYEPRYDENEKNIQQQHENTSENINQYDPQYDENEQNIQHTIEQQNSDKIGKHTDQYEPQYDENGQISQEQYKGSGENTNQYEPQYDENGQIIQQQNFDENGKHIDQYEPQYNEDGQIIQQQYEETGENINKYESQYDENGEHIDQYEPQYDENGEIQHQYEETSHHTNQYEPHQYDENMQINDENSKHIDQNQPQYDENGQIIQNQHEGTSENINTYEPQYDENGQIIQQQNFEDEISLHINQYEPQYDENGQIIQEQYEETGENIDQYESQYGENEHIDQYEHQYDENGQFIGQQYEETGQDIYQYEPQYDENGQIIQQQNFDANNSENIQPQYEPQYDENGQIIQQQNFDANNSENIQPQYEPQYDENGQIIQQQNFDANNSENIQPQYEPQYDENGQIIQQQDFDANNSENIQLQYDENGPVTQLYTPIEEQSNLHYEQYDENSQPIEPHDQKDKEYEESESREIPSDSEKDDRDDGFQNKVMDMLDTDTESLKQNTSKISNESDFDFGSG